MKIHVPLLAACASLAAAGALSTPTAAAFPSQAAITVDGDFADWAIVLQNPDNTTLDGDGSTVACVDSTDRDCAISKVEYDLRRFAWTWDQDGVSLYFERSDGGRPVKYIVYVDGDRDGRLRDFEKTIELQGNDPGFGLNQTRVRSYSAVDLVAGDALVDGAGLADGFDVAGGFQGSGVTVPAALAASADERFHEAKIPWGDLGLAPGQPFDFHVACLPIDGTLPVEVDDNCGGPDGGVGTTAFPALELGPGLVVGAAPGETVRLSHRVANPGTVAFRVDVDLVSSCGLDTELWLDLDGDGFNDTWLGFDAGGDGRFQGAGDVLGPAGDSNGDGRLDLGVLASGEETWLVLQQVMPDDPACRTARTDFSVTSAWSEPISRSAVDHVYIGDVTLVPDEVQRPGVAGDSVWLPHVVRNGTGSQLDPDVTCSSSLSWTCTLFEDPNLDADPADAVALGALSLVAGEQRGLFVRLDVPAGASRGLEDLVFLRIERAGTVLAFAIDRVPVESRLALVPHHLLVQDDAAHGPAGSSVWFAHRLSSAAGAPHDVDLQTSSTRGWPASVFLDPDGDGRPFDATLLVPPSVTLPGGGVGLDLLVRVDVPGLAGQADLDRVTVEAVDPVDGERASAYDETVVTIVSVYEDAARTVGLTQTLPCRTVHGLASGLAPDSPGFRFSWRDPSGLVVRLSPFASDAAGNASDDLVLADGQLGDGWSLRLEEFQVVDWVELDRVPYHVRDPLSVTLLPADDTLQVAGESLRVTATLDNPSLELVARDVSLRWRVLGPGGTQYLDAATSTFAPFTGAEWTATSEVAEVVRGGSVQVDLVVPEVSFPEEGLHAVELHLAYGCEAAAPATNASFSVIDDADGDGLSRTEEIDAGTDPLDADTDDDGRPDGEDGLGDADGDGIPDALECDADGDGLPDGLEVGLTEPHADTAAGGCFAPDTDPATTTDPANPDTDGGGVSDGAEDLDRDGREDAGEGDPLDPADDAGLCATETPPEVTGLRVTSDPTGPRLTWQAVPSDPCTSHAVLVSDSLPTFVELVTDLSATSHVDATAVGPLRFYLVRADSSVAGPGPTGR